MSYTVAGVGTEAGVPYIDLWFYGTNSTGSQVFPQISTNTAFPCSEGETWNASVYMRLVSGTLGGIDIAYFAINQHNSGGAYIKTGLWTTRSTLQTSTSLASLRYSNQSTFTGSGTTAGCKVGLGIQVRAGATIDATIRFGAPQAERGSFPTSYISTSIGVATRAADIYTAPDSGTYFDASGTLRLAPANTPRLDHDPSTSEPKGILIEEQRTNVAPSDITASPWLSYTPGGTVTLVSNSDVAPDGTTTAHRITCGGVGSCTRYMAPTVTSGTTYTFSFFTKAPSGGTICNRGRSGSATGGGVTYFSTNVGNGWIRQGFYETVTSSGTWLPSIINYSLNTPCTIWGPQIETGAFPTSYIPTSGTAVTRAAEVFTLPTSTGWYNSTAQEGTLMAAGAVPYNTNAWPGLATVNDNSTINSVDLYFGMTGGASNPGWSIFYQSATAVAAAGGSSYTPGNIAKLAVAYQPGNARGSSFGILNGLGSPPDIPTVTQLGVGMRRANQGQTNGWVRRVTYFPTRQPDDSLPDYTR